MNAASRFAALPDSLRGGLWMMSGALCFTIMTTLIRDLAQDIHPFEIAFFRIAANVIFMIPFVLRVGAATAFRTNNHKIYMFRALVGVTFLMTFFPGAAMIPVSASQALIFTAPLFATIMAVLFLGEILHVRRIAALAIGFAGALVILRPGLQEISLGAILVLVAAGANATSHIIVKYAMRADHPDQAVLYLSLYVTPLMLIPALFVWTTPDWSQLGMMVAIGAFATLNQRCVTRAFASADATAVLPFDFARLPFAAIIGFLVFSELPDFWVWIGGGIIFTSSVYIAHREAVAAR
jgi:drug/metabolite transporter (DMT)-like permease